MTVPCVPTLHNVGTPLDTEDKLINPSKDDDDINLKQNPFDVDSISEMGETPE